MKTFKKTALVSTLIGLCSTSAIAADDATPLQDARGIGSFITGGAIGGAAGGPVGMIFGALGGVLFSEHLNNHEAKVSSLEETSMQLSDMNIEIEKQELEIAKLEMMIQEKMQLQMYFDTGEDALSNTDSEQLKALADFLKENDYMHVTVDGHTDPRGSDEYNQVLSEQRALSVADTLVQQGVDAARIITNGYGSNFSSGLNGDEVEYAKERKAKVQVLPSKESADLAAID